MKKVVFMVVAVLAVSFVAQNAMAKECGFHQWPPARCIAAAPAPAKPAPAPEKIVLEGVYFDTGSAKIKAESFAILDANVAQLKKNKKDVKVLIVGYTDNVGKPANNQKLSEARAKSVQDYMVSKGIKADHISSKGMGDANPIADNKTKEGKAKNRRIEMETVK